VAVSSVSGHHVLPETVGPVREAIFMSAPGQQLLRLFMNRFPRAFLSATLAGVG